MIQKTTLLLLLVCSFISSYAQEKELRTESRIVDVMVYLNGASLHREATAQVSAGRTKLRFNGLSAGIDANSIQAGVTGNAKVISISHERDFLNNKKESARIARLKDSLDNLNLQRDRLLSDKSIYEEEKKLLTQNIVRIGDGGGVKTAELTAATAFFRTKLKELNDKLLTMQLQQTRLTAEIDRYNLQLSELNSKEKMQTSNIQVIVDAPSATEIKIDLTYLTGVAAWIPKYDIRTSGAGSPIHFEYRANIYNGTGEDWEKVKLTLSTSDPTIKMEKPNLDVWALNFHYNSKRNMYQYQQNQQTYTGGEGRLNNMQMRRDASGNIVDRQVAVEYSEIELTDVSAEFVINDVSTIASDGLPYIVDINEYDLPASYNYYCVPKVSKDVFLIGKVTGWEALNLIEGEANIYLDNTYIGKSFIDTKYSNDTLEIFLGRDRKVIANRIKKQDLGEERFIGTNRRESFIYVIDIRNTNKAPITIEVVDQVPVSQENEIEVSVKEISGAAKDDLSGKLTWNLTVQPAETKKLTISFSVKYPKNKAVQIRQSRKVMAPRF